ncbi:MAG: hypothetical protein KGJ78_06070 [Alphaproteobacteria bacterium]|nr:hypothetical protein [Alphaproteobacteria bacterium]
MKRMVVALSIALFAAGCATRPAAVTPAVPLPPSPPPGEPAGIVGLSSTDLAAAFGKPSFVRKENGSEMWRYDGASCHAFFFLYPAGGGEVVRHVETSPRGAQIAADVNCLAALRGQPLS